MTATVSLSARIAALEATVARGEVAATCINALTQEVDALQRALDAEIEILAQGKRAERVLTELQVYTQRLMDAGESLGEAAAQVLPAPVSETQNPAGTSADLTPGSQPEKPSEFSPFVTATADAEVGQDEDESTDASSVEDPAPADAPAPSEDDEGEDEQEVPTTHQGRLIAWVKAKPIGAVITARDANAALFLAPATCGTWMGKLIPELLERVPGSGVPGRPSEFRRVASGAAGTTDEPSSEPADEAALAPAPAVVQAVPSAPAAILAWLRDHPGREVTAAQLGVETGMGEQACASILRTMARQGLVLVSPDHEDDERRYALKLDEPARPAATEPVMTAIPPRLTPDEVAVFDCLRRQADGLSRKLLAARLNWTQSRCDRVLNALTGAGHVGANGDRLRVIPPELQGLSA